MLHTLAEPARSLQGLNGPAKETSASCGCLSDVWDVRSLFRPAMVRLEMVHHWQGCCLDLNPYSVCHAAADRNRCKQPFSGLHLQNWAIQQTSILDRAILQATFGTEPA